MYLRTIKVRSSNGTVNEYVRAVEAYREDGKVKQRTIADLGRKDLLAQVFPKLRQLLGGDSGSPISVSLGPQVLVVSLGYRSWRFGLCSPNWGCGLPRRSWATPVAFTDLGLVLIANRVIHPAVGPGLASWRRSSSSPRWPRWVLPNWHQRNRVRVHFRQLEAWYRTLDQLLAAKERIELALYHRLRDLFSFKPDLVLYDITSTYFEGAGPAQIARHGHSRDEKPHNVQVIVGVVMVSASDRITCGPVFGLPSSSCPWQSVVCTSDSDSTAWCSSVI